MATAKATVLAQRHPTAASPVLPASTPVQAQGSTPAPSAETVAQGRTIPMLCKPLHQIALVAKPVGGLIRRGHHHLRPARHA